MIRVDVEPTLLGWACQRSGRSLEYLHSRFPKLEAWQQREVLPTLKQLEAFAAATHTPVGYLFLRQPPVVDVLPITDFRTSGSEAMRHPSLDLLDTLRLCQQRQDWYREEVRTVGEPPLRFVGSLHTSTDPAAAAARMREALRFDIEQRRRTETWAGALRQFIDQADGLGLLVMASGVVGTNTHRRLDPEEFRGFALVDPVAPLVFVNGADTKASQMFTLAHEIAHVWLGESGVSNVDVASSPVHRIELWCNRVAAELLVPQDLLRLEFDAAAELHDEATRLARRFKVSTLVVLRRIYDTGGLDRDRFRSSYEMEVKRLRSFRRGTGGNAVNNVNARIGKRLARALVVSTLEGRTSYTEAFRLLGIRKLSTFEKVAANVGLVV